jgi:nucleoside-diphosphate-sugar epimerase
VRALVTGGTGFVGSHLLNALLRRGDQVRALVRSRARSAALDLSGVEWIGGALDDAGVLRRAAEGVDVIYHVAGLVAARSEAEFLEVNAEGTRRLLQAAIHGGTPRFVLVSSLAAGGPTVPGRPLAGDEPPRPVTAYGRSKLAAEDIVRSGPLPWTIIRPPAVYGPRDREMFRLFRSAQLGVAPVFGAGDQELSLIFGPDLAEAIAAAGVAEATRSRLYYAAHPEKLTSEELVRTIGAVMGKRVRLLRIPPGLGRGLLHLTGGVARLANRATILTPDKGEEFFQPAWTCDPAGLTHDTGWSASSDLAQGAAQTLAWYRSAGWL